MFCDDLNKIWPNFGGMVWMTLERFIRFVGIGFVLEKVRLAWVLGASMLSTLVFWQSKVGGSFTTIPLWLPVY